LSLKDARDLRDAAHAMLAKGVNPRLDRKQKRQAIKLAGDNTFMAVYEKWLEHRQLTLEEGRQSSLDQIRRTFKNDVFPSLKRLTIYEITRPMLLEVIGRVEKRDSLRLRQVFDPRQQGDKRRRHVIQRLFIGACSGAGLLYRRARFRQARPAQRLKVTAPAIGRFFGGG
jgi:integrase